MLEALLAALLELNEEALLDALLAFELAAALLAAFELAAALLAAAEELVPDDGPIEHQALVGKLLDGKSDGSQVKLPVSVAYTKEPDLPSATL